MNARQEAIETSAGKFLATLRTINRDALKDGRTIPLKDELDRAQSSFWAFGRELVEMERSASFDPTELENIQQSIAPILFKSKYFAHAYFKPYGYAGDFMMMEMSYDLEQHAGDDPFQSCVVNCLDHTYATNKMVMDLWHRRTWLREILQTEYDRLNGSVAVLDVACGGARYHRDFLSSVESTNDVALSLLDQDPAALRFGKDHQFVGFEHCVQFINSRVIDVPAVLGDATYDVIISAGLFDYFESSSARPMINHLYERLRPGGTIAITNYSSLDSDGAVAFILDFIGNWPLVLKTSEEVRSMFPESSEVEITLSNNESLWLAQCRKP